jgi:asparagine N-glycosylation enzyme membrane subunit Stt3
MSGEFLGRSILGFTDQHVAETLFSATAALFVILAVKEAGQKQLTFGHFIRRDWRVFIKPLIFSLLAGIFLGIYLITWQGAMLFVFIILLYFIIQFIVDHLRRKSTDHLGIIGFVLFLVALIIFFPHITTIIDWKFYNTLRFLFFPMLIAVLVPVVFSVISRLLSARGLKPVYYPLILVGIGIIFIAVLYVIDSNTIKAMLSNFNIFRLSGATATTTLEMQPFLYPQGSFTTAVAWGNFSTNFFLLPYDWISKNLWWFPAFAFVPIVILISLNIKRSDYKNHQVPLWVWNTLLIVATLGIWILFPSKWKILFPGFGFIAIFILIWLFTEQRVDEKQRLLLRILTLLIRVLTLLLLVAGLSVLAFSIKWALVLFIVFFVFLICLSINQRSNEKHWLFFLIWTLTILIATLAQRRFAYYLVVNIAVLSGYLSWQVIWLSGFRKLATRSEDVASISYRQARNVGLLIGIAILITCPFLPTNLAFLPTWIAFLIFVITWLIGISCLLYGCWGWSRYKGKSNWWALWGLLGPIGFLVLALIGPEKKEDKKKKSHKESHDIKIYRINTAIAIYIVILLVFCFNISGAKTVASQATFAPSDAWEASLHWMKQNTPEPMGSPGAYYQLDEVPGEGGYKYPPTAYGVTAWWDYGYWISRTAHRIPSANPSQASVPITKVANLFLANDEASTYAIMKELGSSYIIIDFSTCTTKFWAVNTWAGRDPSEFVGTYYVAKEGKLVPVQLFHPEYYRTLCVRLYNFNGKAVAAKNPAVITFEKKVDNNGNSFEQITDIKQFASYQEALDNVAKEGAANHRIIGLNPFVSPAPLEAVQDYKLIYSSESGISNQDVGLVPEVKIFEYPGK